MALRGWLDVRRSWLPGHAPALLAIPLGLIVTVCVLDVLAPPHIHLGPLLVAAPAITVAFAGARTTAVMGGLAVAAQVLIGMLRGVSGTANIQAQIAALIVVSAVCVTVCVVRGRREQQLHRVRSVAEAAQRVLLQPLPARAGPLRIAGLYIPAEEEAELGGDLYAAARTAHHSTRILLGDVRGSGLGAISNSALLLGAFRAAAHRQATLPRLAVHLDAAFRWDTGQWRSRTEQDTIEDFATAVLLDIPDHDPVVHLISCGHPPPLILRGDRLIPLVAEASHLPIGFGGAFGITDYDVQTFPFEAGDLILLYTDGVIEARDTDGRFYPFTERAPQWTAEAPDQLLRHLRADLLAHVHAHLGDDAAVVAIRRRASAPAPSEPAP
ncbi:PP2C family protein-serine/threonine phosphatase [Streptomyces sp. NBC_01264]|uniref:PP2C family protein-serine/threonine phosphatase n=1 Tax=Streptomyces sp. NBC_01264 TaxID=2903804 RepID=UPI002254713B|nr:PP2C family protein-serine/threonine phosphatase [Streptomyces sp. NBC_01264]MCX4776627.1 serine/threonine-protein phosphatase [Streptomyces sp. NBC_01264]